MTAWGSGRADGKQIPRFAGNDKSFFEGRLHSLCCTGGDARAYIFTIPMLGLHLPSCLYFAMWLCLCLWIWCSLTACPMG